VFLLIQTLLLFDPCTKESMIIPKVHRECSFAKCVFDRYVRGFGYDHSVDDYKYVIIVFRVLVRVYSLGTNTWKRVQDFPYCRLGCESGTLLNGGALHWVISKRKESESLLIGVSDLVEEEFRDAPPPLAVKNFYTFQVFGGCLCILPGGILNKHNDFWAMNGKRESWIKFGIEFQDE